MGVSIVCFAFFILKNGTSRLLDSRRLFASPSKLGRRPGLWQFEKTHISAACHLHLHPFLSYRIYLEHACGLA